MVRSCHTTCRTALEKAVTEGLITTNPAIGCRLPPKKAKEMQVLTQDEIRRFLIQAHEEGYYEFFLLELTTGMRRGEILGLQWKDVNLDTGELHIRRQVVKKGAQTLISKPKTKSSIRTILLPPGMVEILAELKKNATCDWVFPSPVKEGEPRNPDSLYGRFQKILKRAQCKKVRFHDLRHTFATMALENGMDIKTLSAMIDTSAPRPHSTFIVISPTPCRSRQRSKSTERSAVQTPKCPNSRKAWSHPRQVNRHRPMPRQSRNLSRTRARYARAARDASP